MQRLDGGYAAGRGVWATSWKVHVPETLIGAGDYAGARAYMGAPENAECARFLSSHLAHRSATVAAGRGSAAGAARAGRTREAGGAPAFLVRRPAHTRRPSPPPNP
jgi:hypothetical protein